MEEADTTMKTPTSDPHTEIASASLSKLQTQDKLFYIYSVFSERIREASTNTSARETYSATIPKFWSVGELPAQKGQRILFSYAKPRTDSGMHFPLTLKHVVLDTDRQLQYYVNGRHVNTQGTKLKQIYNIADPMPCILEKFQNMNVCSGLGDIDVHCVPANTAFQDWAQQWRHKECSMVLETKKCDNCTKLRKRILQQVSRLKNRPSLHRIRELPNPVDQRKLRVMRMKQRRERCAKNRAKLQANLLMQSIKEKEDQIARIQETTLDEKCSELNVPATQKAALKEIIGAASKTSAKGRRYTEEWMMLCMLMNIRSPGYYEFLRRSNVLPLPCRRTVRTYLSLINMKCGFDKQFAELLKEKFISKTRMQRHGILLLDEINLRKSVAVCSKNLTYTGLTDFGDDGPKSTDINDQATHGLVMMFQPLADTYTQTIGVYASKNPVKGEELAKLVVKGIIYLEECGATIHGVVADGAATNAKMWKILDVRGSMENTKTWFTHPLDDKRKVFVFSDTPHLIKNIRNRLYNKKRLRIAPTKKYIRWEYLTNLYDLDKVHLFSNSVANGLSFYLSHKCQSLTGCEETISFCKQINDMFDALNRKSPNQGLTPGSNDFKVLQDSLRWLNDWESAVCKGDIKPEEYLTPETSKGLRLSLQSTMDMCRYLIEKFDFQYLLTGKVNQDNLEKFFGTIRQSAGCNDHPNCPTFLQLYKMLSVYSVIKPPKFGNCTVSNDRSPPILVSISDLQAIYGKSQAKYCRYLQDIQKKLDAVLENDDWEADDIIDNTLDHNYTQSPILDCIIYYVTGFSF
ncbi:uncharacterized protein [Temnothorax nylanderi]